MLQAIHQGWWQNVDRMDQDQFAHEPLIPLQQQYRLFRIADGECGSSEIIECYIRHFDIGECLPYRAVSHASSDADSEPTREIIMNEMRFCVGEDLWQFLDVARDKKSSYDKSKCSWFWVDAICIDNKVEERIHLQSELIKSIFGGAEEGLSWLGPEGDWSDRFKADLQPEESGYGSSSSPNMEPKDELLYIDTGELNLLIKKFTGLLPPHVKKWLLKINAEPLLERVYWHRVWLL
jgi:hypothetical protein